MELTVQPIGVVRSPFQDKFGVPRQAGLADVPARIELDPERIPLEAVRGLEGATHIWVIFSFHAIAAGEIKSTVRPPRLGGNARLGVLATRSPYRPNRLGLSAVRLLNIRGHRLDISGTDMVDGTPVLDIKPYVAYADAIPQARLDWACMPPARVQVRFAPAVAAALASKPELRGLVEQVLSLDPRPAYHDADSTRTYGMVLHGHDVRFRVERGIVEVVELRPQPSGHDEGGAPSDER